MSDFLSWQRTGTLVLSPSFQRRPVWTPGAKSYLIDTIVRDLPVPVLFVRERVDLKTQQTIREIVDGQQRLRTLFAYIDLSSLRDVNAQTDPFTVSRLHNRELAGKAFVQLPAEVQQRILGYEFSTHVFPSSTDDRDLLTIFARINSTGVALNGQELRNAEYFGVFKQTMYSLALEQLERWRSWSVMSESQIARMSEVELTSDLVQTILSGITGKTQRRLNDLYRKYDKAFPYSHEVEARFRKTMDTIEDVLGGHIKDSVYSSEVYFYSLFALIYDLLYGLGSSLEEKRRPARISTSQIADGLLTASHNLRSENVPPEVLDAVVRASSDTGRRRTRHEYLKSSCGSEK
ncbi:GmrSD restriction endonuclease domain-containing protein [Cellulomonas chengniuliangii]|uniref:GmrSD restriction endonuclease domain-containing protein n=1 Tax=Cellulomonas chengniuliangii TaxID=2968084 RepID=UPI001D0E0BE4|nr:DUF262 domain-containing protein [Cellulomonas chengniuliangii]MCC2318383.1 DUF262 domain-containing protein [Cellulomonas chengniuliangii]